jgi:hypothetical protein
MHSGGKIMNRDENGEVYIEMSSPDRVDLARLAFDELEAIRAEIGERMHRLEHLLSRIIHGDMG